MIKVHMKFLVEDLNSFVVATPIMLYTFQHSRINCMFVTASEQPWNSVDTEYITIVFHVVSLSPCGMIYTYISLKEVLWGS